MIVARQFIAWYACESGNRPVGHGVIGSDSVLRSGTINQPRGKDQTVPYGTELFLQRIPGNELPGYDHLVPTGQNPTVPIGTV